MKFAYQGVHPVFAQPPAQSSLWKYLTLTKLVAMLENGALHFARADKFSDPFEGSWTRNRAPGVLLDSKGALVSPQPSQEELTKLFRGHETPAWLAARWKHGRESTALDCWHLSEHESAAMWQLYASQGIAIRSTFGRLIEALPGGVPGDGTHAICLGRVRYVDYETAVMPEGNSFWPFVHKRLSFAHEHEVRGVIYAIGSKMVTYDGFAIVEAAVPSEGFLVPVKLVTLIEAVHVAPSSPAWMAKAIEAVVRRFALEVPVIQSSLDTSPFH